MNKITGSVMKSPIFQVAFVAIIALLLLNSCEKEGTKPGEGNFFLDAARNTLPVLNSSTSKSAVLSKKNKAEDTWTIHNPLFIIYSMFQNYDPQDENSTVGIDNIYLILHVTGSFFDETMNQGTAIEDQHIASPFDLGHNDASYNVAYNNFEYQTGSAVKQYLNTNYALHAHQRDITGAFPGKEYGIIQGEFNKQTRDLKVDLLSFLDFTEKDIAFRISVEGNDSTHTFTVKYIKYATNESYMYGVGHGISKGDGNYFLFKFTSGESPDALFVTDAYYGIEATASEIELKGMDWLGSATVIPECQSYKAIVDNIAPFTLNDLPSSPGDFNKGGTGVAAEGTVYLMFSN